MHDQLFEKKYAEVIAGWLENVKNRLDQNGLVPHSARPFTGKPLENARGSSQSLILTLLPEIDPELASSQFKIYDSLFFDEILGLPCIREYPKGKDGVGDIDSGPMLFGAGGAATIVGIKAMRLNGNHKQSIILRNVVEALTFPFETSQQKKYLFGALPIADAFITWAEAGEKVEKAHVTFHKFHLYCLLFFLFALFILSWTWKKKSPSKEKF